MKITRFTKIINLKIQVISNKKMIINFVLFKIRIKKFQKESSLLFASKKIKQFKEIEKKTK